MILSVFLYTGHSLLNYLRNNDKYLDGLEPLARVCSAITDHDLYAWSDFMFAFSVFFHLSPATDWL